jgi:hypothetical protein
VIPADHLTFRKLIDGLFMVAIVGIGGLAVNELRSIKKELTDQNIKLVIALEKLHNHDNIIKEHSRKIEDLYLRRN